ncbi:hypothetical protein [Thalassospira sp.]|uniref:hypothetical protein n=1 Tax=Thalassospira sp. TaxID=1912094 RepID=UPI002732D353|nr:hypothetical protein [Thalassospira sp.]MDP2698702.1 hypothetical protein [Thalassospira sp.]
MIRENRVRRAGWTIWVGPSALIALVCVLYLFFVVVLFAGFTADIQREMISRELGISSPGALERVVLQGMHEAELRDGVRNLRQKIRAIDADTLKIVRQGQLLRRDAVDAWRTAFDLYADIGEMVTRDGANFDPGFRESYLAAIRAAYDFLAFPPAGPDGGADGSDGAEGFYDEEPQNGMAAGNVGARSMLRGQETARNREGERIMAALRNAISQNAFSPAADMDFRNGFTARATEAEAATMHFAEIRGRGQVEQINLLTEREQAEKLRSSLVTEMEDMQREIASLAGYGPAAGTAAGTAAGVGHDGPAGHWSLVALFQQPVGSVLAFLMQMPAIMLTLMVTVAAGGLGSVVSFIRRYRLALPSAGRSPGTATVGSPQSTPQSAPQPTPQSTGDAIIDTCGNPAVIGRLLVMVSEGVAAAIAIFLFTQAGMLMVTQGGGSESTGKIDISPFLLTFMAFVSGFMAEDAFNRIQDAGRKLFRARHDGDPPLAGGL